MELVDRRAIVVVVVVAVAEHRTVELVVHTAVLDTHSLVHNRQDCRLLLRVEGVAWRHLLDSWTHALDMDRRIWQKFVDLMEDSRSRLSHSQLVLQSYLARLYYQPALQLQQLRHEKNLFLGQGLVSRKWVKLALQLSRTCVPHQRKLREWSLEVAAAVVGHRGHTNISGPVVGVPVQKAAHSLLATVGASAAR